MTDATGPKRSPRALIGLVLAGGQSKRMGRDKGLLEFQGASLVDRAVRLLRPFCQTVHVSIRQAQGGLETYRQFDTVLDDGQAEGPAAGLLAAWSRFPDCALLVLAVDLPLVDRGTLARLIERRSGDRQATAFRHPDGVPEPLCAIWEPSAVKLIRDPAAGRSPSLRRVLSESDVEWVDPPAPERLVSVNTPVGLVEAEKRRC